MHTILSEICPWDDVVVTCLPMKLEDRHEIGRKQRVHGAFYAGRTRQSPEAMPN